MRSTRKLPDPNRIKFGEKGTRLVFFQGEVPFQHVGVATGTSYTFTVRRPRHYIDLRDLPGLVKATGRDNLIGLDGPVAEEVQDDSRDNDTGRGDA